MSTQKIEVTQVWLGMRPYVLIEAEMDPSDGELVIKVNAGGGATEDLGYLPMLMLTSLPLEQNPLYQVFRDFLDRQEWPKIREAVAQLAQEIGLEIPETAE